jgi:hypothetical protein
LDSAPTDSAAAGPLAWPAEIPDDEWNLYQRVLVGAREAGLRFAAGGAFAAAAHTGRWRNTKDLDLYVVPADRERMIAIVNAAGLKDLYEREAYDRRWIYRGTAEGVIVDVIWAMANQRADVDEAWLTRGPEVTLRGERLRVIPPEEIIWAKLYVFQRDRNDWTDVLNILYNRVQALDWRHLLHRLEDDSRVLAGVLSVFAWLTPTRAQHVPGWVWDRLRLPPPGPDEMTDRKASREADRAALFDSRPWFHATANDSS